jgi:hypothetical protein
MDSSSERAQDAPDSQDSQAAYFYSTFVMEYIVPDGPKAETVFQQWYDRLVRAASQFEGYTRTDLCPPLACDDGVVKWYSIVHFRTPADLKRWLHSSDRTALLEQGRDAFLAYRYKSFTYRVGGVVFEPHRRGRAAQPGATALEAGADGGAGSLPNADGSGHGIWRFGANAGVGHGDLAGDQ